MDACSQTTGTCSCNLDLEKMRQQEDELIYHEHVKQTIEEDKDKKMKMSNKTGEEDKPRLIDFAT